MCSKWCSIMNTFNPINYFSKYINNNLHLDTHAQKKKKNLHFDTH